MTFRENSHYVITFKDLHEDKVVTIKAYTITDSDLGLSFIAVSDFLFSGDSLVVDPAEENLRKRYASTNCIHLSIYNIVSVEEVGEENEGLKFENNRNKLVALENHKPKPDSNLDH